MKKIKAGLVGVSLLLGGITFGFTQTTKAQIQQTIVQDRATVKADFAKLKLDRKSGNKSLLAQDLTTLKADRKKMRSDMKLLKGAK